MLPLPIPVHPSIENTLNLLGILVAFSASYKIAVYHLHRLFHCFFPVRDPKILPVCLSYSGLDVIHNRLGNFHLGLSDVITVRSDSLPETSPI